MPTSRAVTFMASPSLFRSCHTVKLPHHPDMTGAHSETGLWGKHQTLEGNGASALQSAAPHPNPALFTHDCCSGSALTFHFPLPQLEPHACPHPSQTLPAKKVPTANQPLPISMEDLQELEHTQPAQVNVNLVPHKTISEVTPLSSWHPEHSWESSQLPAVPPPGKQTHLPTSWPSSRASLALLQFHSYNSPSGHPVSCQGHMDKLHLIPHSHFIKNQLSIVTSNNYTKPLKINVCPNELL